MRLLELNSAQDWNNILLQLPAPHLLQTYEWGQNKIQNGWTPLHYIWEKDGKVEAAALVLSRQVRLGLRMEVLYCPKGSVLDWQNQTLGASVLDVLQSLAAQRGAVFIKIDPDVEMGRGVPGAGDAAENQAGQAFRQALIRRGWVFSDDQIQFRNTVMIELGRSEEDILAAMKQKTRYNIRLAERKGVSVRTGTTQDHGLLYNMYAETSLRDGFTIRDEAYYRAIWERFSQPAASSGPAWPQVEPLIAEVEGQPVAAVVIFRFAGKAWYLYGMSRQAHREKMPNYLLQWEAMRSAREKGCLVYDLWGAPDTLDASHPMFGVYRFKEGLGAELARTIGAWDYPVRPLLYFMYHRVIPGLLSITRRIRRKQIKQEVVV